MTGGNFTWSNKQENPTLVKDRILMNREWGQLFTLVRVHKKVRKMSDHNPLVLTSVGDPHPKNIPFGFEFTWIKNPEFLIKVEKIWRAPTRDNNMLDKIPFKLKKFKKYFKGWGYNNVGVKKKRKLEINDELAVLEQLEEIMPLNDYQMRYRSELQLELTL